MIDYSILQVLCKKLRISGDFDFKTLAKMTPGFVGADLQALTAAAGVIAIKRMIGQIQQTSFSLASSDKMQIDETPRPPHEEKPRPVSMLHAFIKDDPGPMTPEANGTISTLHNKILSLPFLKFNHRRNGRDLRLFRMLLGMMLGR